MSTARVDDSMGGWVGDSSVDILREWKIKAQTNLSQQLRLQNPSYSESHDSHRHDSRDSRDSHDSLDSYNSHNSHYFYDGIGGMGGMGGLSGGMVGMGGVYDRETGGDTRGDTGVDTSFERTKQFLKDIVSILYICTYVHISTYRQGR